MSELEDLTALQLALLSRRPAAERPFCQSPAPHSTWSVFTINSKGQKPKTCLLTRGNVLLTDLKSLGLEFGFRHGGIQVFR